MSPLHQMGNLSKCLFHRYTFLSVFVSATNLLSLFLHFIPSNQGVGLKPKAPTQQDEFVTKSTNPAYLVVKQEQAWQIPVSSSTRQLTHRFCLEFICPRAQGQKPKFQSSTKLKVINSLNERHWTVTGRHLSSPNQLYAPAQDQTSCQTPPSPY